MVRAAKRAGGEVGPNISVEYVVDTPVARRAMLALDTDRALALQEAHPRYVSKIARLSPLSCSPKHHVLMGWVGSGSGVLQYMSCLLARLTGMDRASFLSASHGTCMQSYATADDSTEMIDGLPWLSH